MAKKQHYMTYEERLQLEALRKAGIPVVQIAKQLGFCRQTIYNELKRGEYIHTCNYWDEPRYSAQKGQNVTDRKQGNKGRPLKIGHDHGYANYLEHKIVDDRYSPAAALADARREGYQTTVCVSTLYHYINDGVFLRLTNDHLWEKPTRKPRIYKEVQRIAHPRLPSIVDRPEWINDRSEPGHWEMDLIVSGAGSNTALLTLTERSSRQEIIRKVPNKKAATIRKELKQLRRQGYAFKSLTTDNGSEFLEYDELKKTLPGTEIYYCHSYAAWEKGSNENHNRMIRRWFPKGTDFSKVTKKRVAEVQDWMNGYPRKILDWNRPMDYAV